MEKSQVYKSLEKSIKGSSEKGFQFDPDNHDQVNMGIGLLNAESAMQMSKAINQLVESNEKTSKVTEKAAFWSKWLTIALIVTTLIVGIINAITIYITSK